jgi:hypothetical protein
MEFGKVYDVKNLKAHCCNGVISGKIRIEREHRKRPHEYMVSTFLPPPHQDKVMGNHTVNAKELKQQIGVE